MEDMENEVLDQETEEVATAESSEEEVTSDDGDFEYDENGDIVVSDDTDDEENDEADGLDEDTESEEDDHDDGGDDEADEVEEEQTEERPDERELENQRLRTEIRKIKNQAKDMLERLGVEGVTDEGVLDGMIKLAAEAADMTPEEYKKVLDTKTREEEQRIAEIRANFERVSTADLAALKKEFPELRDAKKIEDIPNWQAFGKLRDMGFNPAVAYRAVNGESKPVPATVPKKKTLEGTKTHLKTAAGKSAARSGTSMPKAELASWRQMFPEKSDKEIEKLYKDTI